MNLPSVFTRCNTWLKDHVHLWEFCGLIALIWTLWSTQSALGVSADSRDAAVAQAEAARVSIDRSDDAQHIQMIFEINREFYTQTNKDIIKKIRTKMLSGAYDKQDILFFLDNFVMIKRLHDAEVLTKEDLANYFGGYIDDVCKSNYLMDLAREQSYISIQRLCQMGGIR